MDFDADVQDNGSSRKYDFSTVKGGVSLWVETHADRVGAMKAFEAWKEKSGSRLVAVSRRVGAEDKRGAGYRVFFKAPDIDAKPIVASTVRKNTERAGYPLREYILTFTGLHTDDDVLAAVMSVEPPPMTISEASNACRLLWKGETPKQIEYCLQRYGRTFSEIAADKRKEEEEREHANAERQAANVIRLEDIKRQEARALAELERELEKEGDA